MDSWSLIGRIRTAGRDVSQNVRAGSECSPCGPGDDVDGLVCAVRLVALCVCGGNGQARREPVSDCTGSGPRSQAEKPALTRPNAFRAEQSRPARLSSFCRASRRRRRRSTIQPIAADAPTTIATPSAHQPPGRAAEPRGRQRRERRHVESRSGRSRPSSTTSPPVDPRPADLRVVGEADLAVADVGRRSAAGTWIVACDVVGDRDLEREPARRRPVPR